MELTPFERMRKADQRRALENTSLSATPFERLKAAEVAAATPDENEKIYTMADMRRDPQLMEAARGYLGKKGFAWDDDEDLVELLAWEQRKVDSNTVASALRLNEIKDAERTGDMETLQQLKTIHSKWREKASIFGETQWEGAEGLVENFAAGAVDLPSLLYLMPTPASWGTATALKTAGSFAVDAALGAAMNSMLQEQEISVGMRPGQEGLNTNEMVLAAGVSMLPGIGIQTGKALWRGGKAAIQPLLPRALDDGTIPQGFLSKIARTTDEIESANKVLSIETKNSERVYTLAQRADITKEIADDATGRPVLFTSEEAAVDYARKKLGRPDLEAEDLIALKEDKPGLAQPALTLVEKKFGTVKEGRKFLKENGDLLGSSDPENYRFFKGELRAYEAMPWHKRVAMDFRATLSHHVDSWITPRRIGREGAEHIKQRIKDDPSNPDVTKWKALLADDPATIGMNNASARVRSFLYTFSRPQRLVDDPNAPGAKKYVAMENEKTLRHIFEETTAAFAAKGMRDTVTPVKELGGYILAKRLLVEENPAIHNIRTGANVADMQALVNAIESDPVRAPIYKKAADDLRRFDHTLLNYAVDHDLMGVDQAAELIKRNEFYLPVSRLYDGSYMRYAQDKGAKANTLKTAMRRINKPGGQFFLDPFEAYTQQIESIISAATENRYKKQMYDWLSATGKSYGEQYAVQRGTNRKPLTFSVKQIEAALKQKLGPDAVNITVDPNNKNNIMLFVKRELLSGSGNEHMDFYFDKGKMRTVQIRDEQFLEAMKVSGPDMHSALYDAIKAKGMGASFLKGIQGYNTWYAKILVHDPELNAARFLVNDAIFGWVFNPNTMLGLKQFVFDLPFMNAARGMSHSLSSKEAIEFFINGGGQAGLRANVQNSKADLIAHASRHGIDPSTIIGMGSMQDMNLLKRFGHSMVHDTGLGWWGQKTENAVRLGNYMSGVDAGLSSAQAALRANVSSNDWRLHGLNMTSTQVQRTLGLFMRARVNSIYQRTRALTRPDFGWGALAGRWGKFGAVSFMSYMTYEAIVDDDDFINGLPESTKDSYTYIPVGKEVHEGGYITLPKYEEEQWLGNIARKIKDELKKSEVGRAWWGMLKRYALESAFSMTGIEDPLTTLLPPPIVAISQVATDTRAGDPITKKSEEKLSPHLQGDVRDTKYHFMNSPEVREWIRVMNENYFMPTNISPEHVNILARGFFSTAAKYVFDITEVVYKAKTGTYTFKWQDLPFVRQIYKPDKPQRYSSYEERLYDYDDRISRIQNDIHAIETKARTGNVKDVLKRLEISEEKYEKYLAAYPVIKEAIKERQDFMGQLTVLYGPAEGTVNETDREKAADALFESKNASAKQYVEQIEGILKEDKKPSDIERLRQLKDYKNPGNYATTDNYMPDSMLRKATAEEKAAHVNRIEGDDDRALAKETANHRTKVLGLLGRVASTTKDAEYRELATKLAAIVPNMDANVWTSPSGFHATGEVVSDIANKKVSDFNIFRATKHKPSNGMNEETVLHEGIHLAFMNHIFQQDIQVNSVAYRDLFDTHIAFISDFGKMPQAEKDKIKDVLWMEEPLRSFGEFVSYAMTDKNFQSYLKTRPARDEVMDRINKEIDERREADDYARKSIWDKVVFHVTSFLNDEVDANVSQESVESLLDTTMYDRAVRQGKSALNKMPKRKSLQEETDNALRRTATK